MKAWEIGPRENGGGGAESLRQVERPDPVADPDEIVIKVTAAGLNYRDLMVLRGQYGSDLPNTRIPLTDGVGVIEQIGADVDGLAVGDRVIAHNFLDWLDEYGFGFHIFARDIGVNVDGWLAEKIVLPASAAIRVPDSVSDGTAATLAVVGATVWHAMVDFGGIGPGSAAGKLVLAQGTGGVSIFALQLAKALGAEFAITSSSDGKLAKAREMGADYTVNYRTNEDWAAALLEQTGGRGADVVVDTIGFGEFGKTIAATAVEGRIGTIGALSGTPQDSPDFDQGSLIGKNITIKGVASGHNGMLANALAAVAEHGIEILIDREFAFDDAREAYAHLDSAAHMGKVLIRAAS